MIKLDVTFQVDEKLGVERVYFRTVSEELAWIKEGKANGFSLHGVDVEVVDLNRVREFMGGVG